MGIDIHAAIEFWRDEQFETFAVGIAILRNTDLFVALAGIYPGRRPLVPPRGYPPDLSYVAQDFFFVDVVEPADLAMYGTMDGPYLSREDLPKHPDAARVTHRGQVTKIAHPDFHTPGWLTHAELVDSIAAAGIDPARCDACFQAALRLMQDLDRTFGNAKTRLVFAFDS